MRKVPKEGQEASIFFSIPSFKSTTRQGRQARAIETRRYSSRNDIQKALIALAGTGLAPATVNKAATALSTPLGWAARNGLIPKDPTEGIPTFAGKARAKGILTAKAEKPLRMPAKS